jgi:hypothetical protein
MSIAREFLFPTPEHAFDDLVEPPFVISRERGWMRYQLWLWLTFRRVCGHLDV